MPISLEGHGPSTKGGSAEWRCLVGNNSVKRPNDSSGLFRLKGIVPQSYFIWGKKEAVFFTNNNTYNKF